MIKNKQLFDGYNNRQMTMALQSKAVTKGMRKICNCWGMKNQPNSNAAVRMVIPRKYFFKNGADFFLNMNRTER